MGCVIYPIVINSQDYFDEKVNESSVFRLDKCIFDGRIL